MSCERLERIPVCCTGKPFEDFKDESEIGVVIITGAGRALARDILSCVPEAVRDYRGLIL